MVENQEGVKASLAELGTITREADTSISVKLPGAKRAIRLKELLYEREFSLGLITEITAEKQEDQIRMLKLLIKQKENLGKLVREGANEILQNIHQELSKVRKPFRKLQLRSWFIALTAAGLMLVFQVAIEGGIPQWITKEIGLSGLHREGVVQIVRNQDNRRLMKMGENWSPDQDWILQGEDGSWWIRID